MSTEIMSYQIMDFYPRPPRGGRLSGSLGRLPHETISIHALREEGDILRNQVGKPVRIFLSTPSARRATRCTAYRGCISCISIHALREEGDVVSLPCEIWSTEFLSTPSARRATCTALCAKRCKLYFYPRPPRGGRPTEWNTFIRFNAFLSTPSARRATDRYNPHGYPLPISIHALREEGDRVRKTPNRELWDFYPRPPRGGRQQKQRDNTLLLSHYTHPCTNCKEVSVKQAVKLHRYLHSRPLFQCEASRKTMCTVCSHWPDIKRSARCPVQTLGEVQRVRPWSGSCCPVGRTADCLRRGRSGRLAPP